MTEPLCTCGKRPKHKCCEESEDNSGKMCLRGEPKPNNLSVEDAFDTVDAAINSLRRYCSDRLEMVEKL